MVNQELKMTDHSQYRQGHKEQVAVVEAEPWLERQKFYRQGQPRLVRPLL